MPHFPGIGRFSEHSHSADDSSSCSSGAYYCHSNPAYCHPEADLAPSGEAEVSAPSIPTSATEPSSPHHPPATI
ncbi:hypothetical protein AAG906_003060 [Vitis piasezkii]